ncbi:MAG TPA: ankyrin repeat domain-containing protein [Candidatus Latescibacteria bacterium]|nr:ankyrin repeat domain-containing protein [Candidatus Handelsmanbacteria bacterium]HIL11685.1 ankyrin repeat domain-containing protein [Candidatus Latescibacterota bacterium]
MKIEQTEHPVFHAIECGDLSETIRLLGDAQCDTPRNAWNATPLIMAAWHGHLGIAKTLLDRGADINAFYNAGNTPLIVAAWHGHVDVVKYLLSEGVDIAFKNRGGDDALAWAAEHGHLEILESLLAAGADSVDAALVFACENGHGKIAALLLCKGASLEYQHGEYHLTPLAAAAYKGYLDLVQFLLDEGANIHALDDAALGWACGSQQLGTAEFLISHEANVHGHGAEGLTFLQEAEKKGRTTVADFLRRHGARE